MFREELISSIAIVVVYITTAATTTSSTYNNSKKKSKQQQQLPKNATTTTMSPLSFLNERLSQMQTQPGLKEAQDGIDVFVHVRGITKVSQDFLFLAGIAQTFIIAALGDRK